MNRGIVNFVCKDKRFIVPIILEKELKPDVFIGVWKITESAEELLRRLQLNEEERGFLKKLQSNKRYLHWLSSRVMIRKLLNTDEFIEMETARKGKPAMKNFPHELSIAHSHEMAAVIISEENRVGVDIEHIDDKVKRIAHKFLSEEEMEEIDSVHDTEHLIQCWCAKEALFKYYGKGQVDFRQHLHLRHYDYKESGRMEASILKDDCLNNLVVHYQKVEQYMLAYVFEEEDDPDY